MTMDELLERASSVANLAMLRTYAEPSPMQIAAINEYTPLLESELNFLPPNDAYTRERILAQLDIHRSVLAPIRRLPKELLIEIFFLVAYESSLRTLQVAVTIARVCAVWRAVAHGLTKFWTRVVVRTPSDFDQYCELFLPITTQENRPGLRCDDPKILWDLWERIEPCTSCWGSITIEGQLSMLPDLKVLYMENLERLVVNAYDAPLSPEISVLDFVVAPRLHHIALTLDTLQSERQLHAPVIWRLTSLEIEAMSPYPVTHTLPLLWACAGTLQSLILKIRYPLNGLEDSYSTSPSDTFVMKALTLLSLCDTTCALLNHISASLIDELILSNVSAYGTQSLLAFLTRSQAARHLRILRVYQAREREISAWIPCVQLLDSLTELHCDELLSNKEFLEMMVCHPDKQPLLPSLEEIAIVHIFRKHPELHAIIGKMVGSRMKETVVDGQRAWIEVGWIEE